VAFRSGLRDDSGSACENCVKGLFTVAIVQQDDGKYVAEVQSLLDRTKTIVRAGHLGLLIKRISGKIIQRSNFNKKFPPKQPSVIIQPGDPAASLIVPARN